MTTQAKDCPNHEINEAQCPCPNTECERHGICCECVASHVSKGGESFCMRGTERPVETRGLPIGQHPDCASRTRNDDRCGCPESSCVRRGLCCDCIRYHWGHSVWPRVSCM